MIKIISFCLLKNTMVDLKHSKYFVWNMDDDIPTVWYSDYFKCYPFILVVVVRHLDTTLLR